MTETEQIIALLRQNVETQLEILAILKRLPMAVAATPQLWEKYQGLFQRIHLLLVFRRDQLAVLEDQVGAGAHEHTPTEPEQSPQDESEEPCLILDEITEVLGGWMPEGRSDDQTFLRKVLDTLLDEDIVSEEQWDELSKDTQLWANNAADAVKRRVSLPNFSDPFVVEPNEHFPDHLTASLLYASDLLRAGWGPVRTIREITLKFNLTHQDVLTVAKKLNLNHHTASRQYYVARSWVNAELMR